MAAQCTGLPLRANQYSEITNVELEIENQKGILRIHKSEFIKENTFNGDLFRIEDNYEYSEDERSKQREIYDS